MRNRLSLFLLGAIPFSFSANSLAQSSMDCTIDSVPVEIVVNPLTWQANLITRPIERTAFVAARASLPDSIQVRTLNENGDSLCGIQYCNTKLSHEYSPRCLYPGLVVLRPDGEWVIDMLHWGMACGPGLAPGECHEIAGSEDARLMVATEPTLEHMEPVVVQFSPRSPSFTLDYDHAGAPAGLSQSDVIAAIDRAATQYVNLFPTESFSLTLQVRWVNFSGEVLMSTAASGRDDRSWNSVNQNLQLSASGVDQDTYEDNIVLELPNGSQVSYTYASNSSTSTSRICLPVPLLQKWYGAGSNDPVEISIDSTLLNNRTWDLNSWLGGVNALDPNSYDFEAAFVHEIGHGLGFWSELEEAQSAFYNFISNWDVFRFPTSIAPIDGAEMQGTARNLRPAIPSCGCTQLNNAGRCFELAQGAVPAGDQQQASHWKDRFVTSSNYIGIMDSFQSVDELVIKNGKYIQDADVFAFDLMGYEIDVNSVIAGVEPVPSTTPANNSTVPAGALVVSWDPAPNATSYDIYVDCLSCLVTYVQQGILGTSHTIPAGILQNGTYTIVVTARNWRGFVSTPISVNVTGGTSCDSVDFNNDGGSFDPIDIDAFLSVFGEGPCIPATATCNDIDFNNDGATFDPCDIASFLFAFGEGPCTPCGE